ncbi:hypothetical protein, partial [Leifsonia shinshuensis]|uniref:hypothetical protein n=1 Tax=Leifsonia shinshuensis TaxID=150026 RepID=UPI0035F04E91
GFGARSVWPIGKQNRNLRSVGEVRALHSVVIGLFNAEATMVSLFAKYEHYRLTWLHPKQNHLFYH